jgi:transcriptional repressor NrdR
MHCPICKHTDTKVIDSRVSQDGDSTRRRRKCENCDYRFTSYEKVQLKLPMITKADGRREDYSHIKIIGGIKKACQKRPVSSHQIEEMLEKLERKLASLNEPEISSRVLGEIVMQGIYELDAVAFVRYASFYWDFDDIKGFIRSLKKNLDGFEIDIPNQMM